MAMVSRHSNKSPKTSPLRDDPYLMLLKFLRQGVFFSIILIGASIHLELLLHLAYTDSYHMIICMHITYFLKLGICLFLQISKYKCLA